MVEDKAYQATPVLTLERQIMDSNVPKNEREWWARNEIKRLRERDQFISILDKQIIEKDQKIKLLREQLLNIENLLWEAINRNRRSGEHIVTTVNTIIATLKETE